MYIVTLSAIDTNAKPFRIHLDDCFASKSLDQAEDVYNASLRQILDRHSYNGYEFDNYDRHACDVYTADGITYHVELKEVL